MTAGACEPWRGSPPAILWDQSLVWGLICTETLQQLGIPAHLVSARDIAGGCLDNYRVLLVPGGWASHKMRALGKAGKDAIRRFIERGGSYLGFCGGAGLALSSPPSLGLIPLKRMPLSERLPSASGGVHLRADCDHPVWKGAPSTIEAPVWWPSQFLWEPQPGVECIATYTGFGEGFSVADLPASDLEEHPTRWETWEKIYGINLDPRRLLGHPAIIEAQLGKGRLVLSYPHLETPGCQGANRMLLRVLGYLDLAASRHLPGRSPAPIVSESLHELHPERLLDPLLRMQRCMDDLIAFGERHLLWRWRFPWLLYWRRGIRGLEYGSLAVIARFLVRTVESLCSCRISHDASMDMLWAVEEDLRQFCFLAKRLLIEERLAFQSGHLTKLGNVNDAVDGLRAELFGGRMNHGGLSQTIFDQLDPVILHLLRLRLHTPRVKPLSFLQDIATQPTL